MIRFRFILIPTFVLFTFPSNGYEVMEEITAVERKTTSVPCHAIETPPDTRRTISLIRWFHSNFHKPIYTLDLRSARSRYSLQNWTFDGGVHFPSPETEGRVFFDLKIKPMVLRIDPVESQDEGIYTCRIDFKNQRSAFNNVKLNVVVPPTSVVIRNSHGQKVEGVIGPHHLGDTVNFTCEGIGGRPLPLVHWTYGASDVEALRRVHIKGNILTVSSLKRQDQWTHYTCTVTNNNITSPKSSTVIVELVLPPMELLLHSDTHRPFSAGQQIHITCQSIGSYPRALVSWTRNGVPLDADERLSDNGNVTTSYIRLIAEAGQDLNKVECIARNPSVDGITLRRTFIIRVNYKPEVKAEAVTAPDEITEGRNMNLVCSIRANPEPIRVTWKYEGKPLSNSSEYFMKDTSLHIKNLNIHHSGSYACSAENIKGIQEDSVLIAVKHKPVCQTNDFILSYDERNGDSLNVTCNLAAYPSDVRFYWMLRYSSSNHSWSTGQASQTRVELQESSSELVCWGRNQIGIQISPCRILLTKGKTSHFSSIQVLLITACTVIISLFVLFLIIKKYKGSYDLNSLSTENEMVDLKDESCGRLISKCVKTSSGNSEGECSANLLEGSKKYADISTTTNDL